MAFSGVVGFFRHFPVVFCGIIFSFVGSVAGISGVQFHFGFQVGDSISSVNLGVSFNSGFGVSIRFVTSFSAIRGFLLVICSGVEVLVRRCGCVAFAVGVLRSLWVAVSIWYFRIGFRSGCNRRFFNVQRAWLKHLHGFITSGSIVISVSIGVVAVLCFGVLRTFFVVCGVLCFGGYCGVAVFSGALALGLLWW